MKHTVINIVLAVFCLFANAQSAGDDGITVDQSTGQGTIEREKELVPSFNELLWNDLFGLEFDSQRDMLILKKYPDGSAEIHPVRAINEGWVVEAYGTYSGHAEVLDDFFDLYEENVVLETQDGTQILDVGGLLSSFAATIVGSNGVRWIVSGYMYDMYWDYTAPTGGIRYEYTVLVPMNRHMNAADAVDSLGDYYAQRRTADSTICGNTWRDCDDQAYSDYQTGLAVVDATSPFYSGGGAAAGGTAGAGVGGLIGWLFGPPGAGVGSVIGGTLGALGGGLAAAHYEHSGMRYAETQKYNNRIDRCRRCYESCLVNGTWPSWCGF